ncbi:putative serine/threonine-protein kinase [Elaeis guineensis]|uniref:putative serine/threonine-protein kinase n=1 Tax=Elaeis guineensis var. tenera TaxID=51953 RepID=UPI003C6CE057
MAFCFLYCDSAACLFSFPTAHICSVTVSIPGALLSGHCHCWMDALKFLVRGLFASFTVSPLNYGMYSSYSDVNWLLRVQIAYAVAKALRMVHAGGMTLYDFKTSNVLIDENYTPKIGDFGLAVIEEIPVHWQLSAFGTRGHLRNSLAVFSKIAHVITLQQHVSNT